MWCDVNDQRPLLLIRVQRSEVRVERSEGEDRETRFLNLIFELWTWKPCLVGLALTLMLGAAAAARLDSLSLGLGIFTFAFRLLLFVFVSLLGFGSDSSINVDVALQHESWVAAWVVGASLTANRRFGFVWFPKREVSEGRVRGIEKEKKRRRKKKRWVERREDRRTRTVYCLYRIMLDIQMCDMVFVFFLIIAMRWWNSHRVPVI